MGLNRLDHPSFTKLPSLSDGFKALSAALERIPGSILTFVAESHAVLNGFDALDTIQKLAADHTATLDLACSTRDTLSDTWSRIQAQQDAGKKIAQILRDQRDRLDEVVPAHLKLSSDIDQLENFINNTIVRKLDLLAGFDGPI